MSEWNLGITESEFDEIYFGLSVDKECFTRVPETDVDYQDNFANRKLWRLNNWYHIIDKWGEKIWFVMNYAQHRVFARQLRHGRSLILKSRQRGISTFFLIDYFDDAITLDNLAVGMQSYGLEESSALLEKLTVAWETLSDSNKSLLELGLVKNNTKAISFTNGSQVRVATSFRGNTLHRLHVSELGKIAAKDPKKARELKTGTLQAIKAGNPVAIESTAEGQHNAFYDWWFTAIDIVGARSLTDFDPVFLSWVDDPDCRAGVDVLESSEDAIEMEVIEEEWAEYASVPGFTLTKWQRWWFIGKRRELGDKFYQEYPHTPDSAFSAVKDGTYYARLWRREGSIWGAVEVAKFSRERLYDPLLPVYTAWDLGYNDTNVVLFFQTVGRELRIVDEYHNSGEGLEHYAQVLWDRKRVLGYSYAGHILPHDAGVTDMTSAVTRKRRLWELGLRHIKVLRRTKDVNADIEQVRRSIPSMWIDPVTCSYIIRMMARYSKKWDEVLEAFKEKPLHNEWSNPADAVRYMVLGRKHDVSSSADRSRGGGDISDLSSNVVDGMAL